MSVKKTRKEKKKKRKRRKKEIPYLRACLRCGEQAYVRNGVCLNPYCVSWLHLLLFFFFGGDLVVGRDRRDHFLATPGWLLAEI